MSLKLLLNSPNCGLPLLLGAVFKVNLFIFKAPFDRRYGCFERLSSQRWISVAEPGVVPSPAYRAHCKMCAGIAVPTRLVQQEQERDVVREHDDLAALCLLGETCRNRFAGDGPVMKLGRQKRSSICCPWSQARRGTLPRLLVVFALAEHFPDTRIWLSSKCNPKFGHAVITALLFESTASAPTSKRATSLANSERSAFVTSWCATSVFFAVIRLVAVSFATSSRAATSFRLPISAKTSVLIPSSQSRSATSFRSAMSFWRASEPASAVKPAARVVIFLACARSSSSGGASIGK